MHGTSLQAELVSCRTVLRCVLTGSGAGHHILPGVSAHRGFPKEVLRSLHHCFNRALCTHRSWGLCWPNLMAWSPAIICGTVWTQW